MLRKPSEYLPAALSRIQGSLAPDCTEILRYGDTSAKVTRVGTPKRGENTATNYEPIEGCRVRAFASDFPTLAKWATVTYRGELRFVTCVKTDPARALLIIGLTYPLEPVVWQRDEAPHNAATFNAAIDDTGPTQSAGPTYAPIEADAVRVFLCGGDVWAAGVSVGDTLRRANGEVLAIQQIKRERPFALVLTCTTDMKASAS